MGTWRKRIPRSAVVTALLAAVVTAAALVAVVQLRPKPDDASTSQPVQPEIRAGAAPGCGAGACQQLATMTVAGTPVVLLAGADGQGGRVRIGPQPGTEFELSIIGMGAKLSPSSLRCIAGSTSACLVRGETAAGGAYGELLTGTGEVWRDFGRPYFADAGTLSLFDVTQDGRPDVIVVRHECPNAPSGTPACDAAPVLAEVYDLDGKVRGCTATVRSPSSFRGWPEVEVRKSQLKSCAGGN
jgi:hypothetical protein